MCLFICARWYETLNEGRFFRVFRVRLKIMAARKPRKRSTNKLRATIAEAFPETVPTRWVKSVVGVFLLPLAWVLTQTFFSVFTHVTVHADF